MRVPTTAVNTLLTMPIHRVTAKPLNRARAELEEDDARQKGRDVGVEDGRQSALVARVDRGARRLAQAELLADALVDQHVGIDRHTESQHDAGDARQGQGRAQGRHSRHQEHDVEHQARSASRPATL